MWRLSLNWPKQITTMSNGLEWQAKLIRQPKMAPLNGKSREKSVLLTLVVFCRQELCNAVWLWSAFYAPVLPMLQMQDRNLSQTLHQELKYNFNKTINCPNLTFPWYFGAHFQNTTELLNGDRHACALPLLVHSGCCLFPTAYSTCTHDRLR